MNAAPEDTRTQISGHIFTSSQPRHRNYNNNHFSSYFFSLTRFRFHINGATHVGASVSTRGNTHVAGGREGKERGYLTAPNLADKHHPPETDHAIHVYKFH